MKSSRTREDFQKLETPFPSLIVMKDFDSVFKNRSAIRESNEKERNETFVSLLSRTRQPGDHPLSPSETTTQPLSNQNKEIHFSALIKISPTKGEEGKT